MSTNLLLHNRVKALSIFLLLLSVNAAPLFRFREFEQRMLETPTTTDEPVPAYSPKRPASCPNGFVLKRVQMQGTAKVLCEGFAGISAVSSACGDGFIHAENEDMCYKLSCLSAAVVVSELQMECQQKPHCSEERDQFVRWIYRNKICYRTCPAGFRLNDKKCEKELYRTPFCEENEELDENGMCVVH